MSLKSYTAKEEIANSITHGIGTGLSVVGGIVLVALSATYGDIWRVVSLSIYAGSLVVLYLASTLYHSFNDPKIKHILRIIDHAAIYVLIAGSYTPFLLVSLRGTWGWTLLGIVWGLALLGIVFKTLFIHRFRRLSTLVYIGMGWLCIVAAQEMLARIPVGGLILLAAGGLLYTAGVIFYAWRKLPYHHAVWHGFVLAGSACHYFAILFYVLPSR